MCGDCDARWPISNFGCDLGSNHLALWHVHGTMTPGGLSPWILSPFSRSVASALPGVLKPIWGKFGTHILWCLLLSSAIYSIYYSRYSTPYLSGEGKREDLVVVVVVVREQETLLLDAIERQVYILLGKCYRHSYTAWLDQWWSLKVTHPTCLTGPLTHTYHVTPGQLFTSAGSAIMAIRRTRTASTSMGKINSHVQRKKIQFKYPL